MSWPLPYAVARDEFEFVIAWLKGRWKWGAVRALRTAYQLDENILCRAGSLWQSQAAMSWSVPTPCARVSRRAEEIKHYAQRAAASRLGRLPLSAQGDGDDDIGALVDAAAGGTAS